MKKFFDKVFFSWFTYLFMFYVYFCLSLYLFSDSDAWSYVYFYVAGVVTCASFLGFVIFFHHDVSASKNKVECGQAAGDQEAAE